MSVLPTTCRALGGTDAEYRSGNRKWNVICEIINGAGQKEIKDHITVIAPSEAEATNKAKSHFKGKGAVSVRIYSIHDLG